MITDFWDSVLVLEKKTNYTIPLSGIILSNVAFQLNIFSGAITVTINIKIGFRNQLLSH